MLTSGMYASRHSKHTSESPRTHPAEEKDGKEAHLENQTGVLHLCQHESVPILLHAIRTLPLDREFNGTEHADHAGSPGKPWTTTLSPVED